MYIYLESYLIFTAKTNFKHHYKYHGSFYSFLRNLNKYYLFRLCLFNSFDILVKSTSLLETNVSCMSPERLERIDKDEMLPESFYGYMNLFYIYPLW